MKINSSLDSTRISGHSPFHRTNHCPVGEKNMDSGDTLFFVNRLNSFTAGFSRLRKAALQHRFSIA